MDWESLLYGVVGVGVGYVGHDAIQSARRAVVAIPRTTREADDLEFALQAEGLDAQRHVDSWAGNFYIDVPEGEFDKTVALLSKWKRERIPEWI